MSAREAILNRVRAARSAKALVERNASHRPVGTISAAESAMPSVDLLSRFSRELDALGVECHIEPTPHAVRDRIRQLAEGQAVFSWDADRLPYDVGAILSSPLFGTDTRGRQAEATLGVTGCHAAIAETGSLVVLSGPGTPRAASLLPPAHVCVVRRADLVATMGTFFRERAADIAVAACCTVITGPSRTADIELTLTLGVHGPGKVMVIVGP
jgi:L-lactate dehydrogenase complex protein LldG